MSERRYVVEIARAVADDRIESAADYVAMRLGMDRQRIRTLLAGRTGAVTKPVLAEKADSIAEVFTAAGVTVMIMEAPEPAVEVEVAGLHDEAGDDAGAADTDYEAAYQEEFSQDADLPVGGWNVDSAWETDDEDVPWDEGPDGASEAQAHHVETPDSAPDNPTARSGQVVEQPEPAASEGSAEPAEQAEPKLPSTRWVPSPFDETGDTRVPRGSQGDDLKITWNTRADQGRSQTASEAHSDSDDLDQTASRPWVTPGQSRFGDLSAPGERTPLRSYLIWALVVSVVALIILQLVFAVRERGTGATYDTGLLAYRNGDFVSARRQWETVAKSGNREAQFMLGHLVQNGLGQPWSNAQAAQWYRQAAEQGLPEAQVALADLYIRGVGVAPSLETGAQWLARAAEAGHGPALFQYAELRLHGRGVPQDFDAALDLFGRAAAKGSNEAADMIALASHVRNATSSAQP